MKILSKYQIGYELEVNLYVNVYELKCGNSKMRENVEKIEKSQIWVPVKVFFGCGCGYGTVKLNQNKEIVVSNHKTDRQKLPCR